MYLACRALHSAIQVIEFFIYKKKHMDEEDALELTDVQSEFCLGAGRFRETLLL